MRCSTKSHHLTITVSIVVADPGPSTPKNKARIKIAQPILCHIFHAKTFQGLFWRVPPFLGMSPLRNEILTTGRARESQISVRKWTVRREKKIRPRAAPNPEAGRSRRRGGSHSREWSPPRPPGCTLTSGDYTLTIHVLVRSGPTEVGTVIEMFAPHLCKASKCLHLCEASKHLMFVFPRHGLSMYASAIPTRSVLIHVQRRFKSHNHGSSRP